MYFPKFIFVVAEAERIGDAIFLSVKNHGRAVDRVADTVTDECLEGIGVVVFVVRSGVKEHEPLAISGAPRSQKSRGNHSS